MSLSTSIFNVECVVKRLPYFGRLQSKSRVRMSTDVTFVGLALRTGCLIDSLAPEDPIAQFTLLLNALHDDESTRELVSSIAHVFEPTSEQSFLVNVKLLLARIPGVLNAPTSNPTLVKLYPGSRCEIQKELSPSLRHALSELLRSLHASSRGANSILLPHSLSMEITVPLAAIILDYPVAYIPTTTPSNPSPIFLSGVPVRTYECVLTCGSHAAPPSDSKYKRVSVMKFSCPQNLEEEKERIAPEAITDTLHAMFAERVAEIGDESAAFEIVCETVTFDRLAL